VRIVKHLLCLLSLLVAVPAQAQSEAELRRIEASLLNLAVDLGGVQKWDGTPTGWHPVAKPDGPLLILHLWAVDCPPCIAEFPMLRSLVEAWKTQPEVSFLFVSETLSRDQLTAFWRQNKSQPTPTLYQSTDPRIRQVLETQKQPLTLLLDRQLIVRQAFVGALGARTNELTSAILHILKVAPLYSPTRRPSARP
jgi:thiol-disulfide isomerase/thioredoxin